MSVRSQLYLGFALACLTGPVAWAADDAPKGRPAPIVFSAPKSDAVSSNLNQMGNKSSSLMDLESGLRKPFEIFDAGRSSGGYQPPNRFAPPVAPGTIPNRRLREAMDKRADESYLLSEDKESDRSRDELMGADREAIDPITGRPKTSLDRYYDRLDRGLAGATNKTSGSLDLFGEKIGVDEKGDLARQSRLGGLFDYELSANARGSGQTNNSEGRWYLEKPKPRSSGGMFELGAVEPAQPAVRNRETRMDEFKKLLDGPGYGARRGFNAPPPQSALGSPYQPPKSSLAAPGSSLSMSPQPSGSAMATTPGFSGAVGVPMGAPTYPGSSSLNAPPVPPPAQKPPTPSFKIPRPRLN